jgi:uncharacterized protein YaaN involved in tellurite resistance
MEVPETMELKPETKEMIELSVESGSENPPAPTPEEEKEIESLVARLDHTDRSSALFFGTEAQEKLDIISGKMIDGVKNKDTGAAGEALNKMVAAIRGFDIDSLDPNRELPWWQKLMGKSEPLAEFVQGYEEVRNQLDLIAEDLEKHRSRLTRDIVALDKLYDANLEYFRQLELYIEAGEKKLEELDTKILPEYEKEAQSQDMTKVQELREIRGYRDDLERRVHDLRLSRQVAMQALPSIRLIQENDKSLINKISSTLVNTVPLWRNQLAQTITIFRSHDAARAIKGASDLTNELLEKNAEGLREANAEVRKQMERGIFDIESIKKANRTLIETLNDSLRIAQEGKKARESAIVELQKAESELKEALMAVKSKELSDLGTAKSDDTRRISEEH